MLKSLSTLIVRTTPITLRAALIALLLTAIAPFNIFSATFTFDRPDTTDTNQNTSRRLPITKHPRVTSHPGAFPDSIEISYPDKAVPYVVGDSIYVSPGDSTIAVVPQGAIPVDTCTYADPNFDPDYIVREFNPDPTRAAWMSALFPGLGQLYNRRYWKLPIVAGGFMGLLYGYSWNNRMFKDYTQGYRDLMDKDPLTNSYMDFYPPGTDESSLNQEWLQRLFKNRKDFYRRNRDFCVLGMIGVYLVAIVDAYVDASLTHFDITPDLSLDMAPTLMPNGHSDIPGVGLAWALNF